VPTLGVLLLVALVSAACASRGSVPRPFPGASLPPGATDPAGEPVTEPTEAGDGTVPDAVPVRPGPSAHIIQTATEYLGVPYRFGGSDPSGFDCSGLMQWVFARHGTALPREVRDQYRVGREVRLKDIQPGDLIFFETVSRGASHVGMVIGEGRFVHAPSSKGVVRVEPYTANYWIRRLVGARRVIDVKAPTPEQIVPAAVPASR
jgi:cell wall-associated NlpC family hydrolase